MFWCTFRMETGSLRARAGRTRRTSFSKGWILRWPSRSSRSFGAGRTRARRVLQFLNRCYCIAPLAQLDRASGYEPEGREFESLRARHFFSMFTRVSEVRRESSRARSPLGFTSVLPSAAGATLHEEREALEQLGGPARASRISCCIPLRFFAEKDQTHFLFLLFSFCARKRTSESLTRSLRAEPQLLHLVVLFFGEKGKCGVRSYAVFRSALKHLHIRKKTHCQAVQRFLECAAS